MYPVDGSDSRDFEGIDYTAHLRAPAVYDAERVENRVMEILQEYLTHEGFSARRCVSSGFGSAGTGTPVFYEILQWIQDHWEFFYGAASVALAWVASARAKANRLKKKLEDRVLDPYKPSVIVELGVRTRGDGDLGRDEAGTSFKSFLLHVPGISDRLRRDFPRQNFSIRIISSNYAIPYAFFKVADVRKSDIAKMIGYVNKQRNHEGVGAVLLYRKFGFLTRLEASRNPQDLMRFLMRS